MSIKIFKLNGLVGVVGIGITVAMWLIDRYGDRYVKFKRINSDNEKRDNKKNGDVPCQAEVTVCDPS